MIVIRRYEPVLGSNYPWARVPRLLIQLDESGRHAHAFRSRSGAWEVTYRDVAKGRISGAQRDLLNRLLADISAEEP
jgi:hypothetical protein